MTKKGQAAMEFLMTYGWAILVVLIVIAALAYFGVLDPSNVLPDKCTFPISLTCDDFLVSTSQGVRLSVINNAGKGMTVTGASAAGPGIQGVCATAVAPGLIAQGTSSSLNITTDGATVPGTCTFINTGKRKDKYTITVNYSLEGSTFQKSLTGDLLSKREI